MSAPDDRAGDPAASTVRHSGPRFRTGFATLRDLLSFVAGLVILGHEVFGSGGVEPYSVAAGAALVGLPLVISVDERRKGGGDD